MIIECTKENKEIKDVAATMAIENMFLSEDFLNEVIKVKKGEKTFDELRQEIREQYGKS
jgi:ABC-type phosphate/phosphonate transport system ATPase subunit